MATIPTVLLLKCCSLLAFVKLFFASIFQFCGTLNHVKSLCGTNSSSSRVVKLRPFRFQLFLDEVSLLIPGDYIQCVQRNSLFESHCRYAIYLGQIKARHYVININTPNHPLNLSESNEISKNKYCGYSDRHLEGTAFIQTLDSFLREQNFFFVLLNTRIPITGYDRIDNDISKFNSSNSSTILYQSIVKTVNDMKSEFEFSYSRTFAVQTFDLLPMFESSIYKTQSHSNQSFLESHSMGFGPNMDCSIIYLKESEAYDDFITSMNSQCYEELHEGHCSLLMPTDRVHNISLSLLLALQHRMKHNIHNHLVMPDCIGSNLRNHPHDIPSPLSGFKNLRDLLEEALKGGSHHGN